MTVDEFFAKYAQAPAATRAELPTGCGAQLEAVGLALKATGIPLAGPITALGVAGIILAELYASGWRVDRHTPAEYIVGPDGIAYGPFGRT